MKSFANPVREKRRAARSAHAGHDARHRDELAEFQQALGNRALTQLLSRATTERSLQRWGGWGWWYPRPAAPAQSTYTVTAEGIGSFTAKAFHFLEPRAAGTIAARPKERETERERRESEGADFTIVKPIDKLSAGLHRAMIEGRHIPQVEIVIEKPPRRVVLRFKDVLVANVSVGSSAHGEPEPLEQFRFNGVRDEKSSQF